MSDLILLAGATAVVVGYERSRRNVFNILGWAGNLGDINTATGRNTDIGLPNVGASMLNSKQMFAASQIAPYAAPMREPLSVKLPVHPSHSSPLTRSLGRGTS